MTQLFDATDEQYLAEVVKSGVLWRGNGALWSGQSHDGALAAERFEDAFAAWVGAPFGHAVNSGTSANEAAVWSLGLPRGSEVLCPSACPVFVPMSVLAAGCIPVFVDVDPDTMLMDPTRLAETLSENTRAIVVVHLWGHPAPMREIMAFAAAHDLRVVEDCAQAAASFYEGARLGTMGDAACFSLQQSKLVTAGEGGVVTTRDAASYVRSVLYSNTGIPSLRHGITLDDVGLGRNGVQSFGHNHRMSELQAAVALAQLEKVDTLIEGRARTERFLREAIDALGDDSIAVIEPSEGSDVSLWRLPVRVAPGRGDYVGIPQAEPVFTEMSVSRRTPFGAPLPDHVDYGPASYRGAAAGASTTRVLAIDPFATERDAERLVAARLTDS